MSEATCGYQTECHWCHKYKTTGGCEDDRHTCNVCETCEGTLYSFGEELDLDLCEECLSKVQAQMLKGLIPLNQGKKDSIILEEITTIRKAITEKERQAIFDRNNWRCVECGSEENLQVDHIIPFSKGGTTDLDNLQTLCRTCNRKKSNKVPCVKA